MWRLYFLIQLGYQTEYYIIQIIIQMVFFRSMGVFKRQKVRNNIIRQGTEIV
jgi:hypothetical protein